MNKDKWKPLNSDLDFQQIKQNIYKKYFVVFFIQCQFNLMTFGWTGVFHNAFGMVFRAGKSRSKKERIDIEGP